ncbi:hypothetical protein [Micromonospora sp. NPDC048830]|uniref:hypothetical protein n=1 Tax=Micromonospora sp. NPDC048830 TaxID=3364257 RepID=UPI003714168F
MERKTCWSLAERAGHADPQALLVGAGRLRLEPAHLRLAEIDVAFMGQLDAVQGATVSALLAHDDGVLVAPERRRWPRGGRR